MNEKAGMVEMRNAVSGYLLLQRSAAKGKFQGLFRWIMSLLLLKRGNFSLDFGEGGNSEYEPA
jgi:hypothetical protein